jgi:hypothetical protein
MQVKASVPLVTGSITGTLPLKPSGRSSSWRPSQNRLTLPFRILRRLTLTLTLLAPPPPHPSAPPMASLFGARRRRSPEYDGEDDRSGGGRAKRRRLSPEEAAASPAEPGAATGTSHGWLSGFVSGAKRAISSVLLSSSPEETGSGEDGEVEEEDDDVYEEGIDLSNFSFLSLVRALALSLRRSVQ